MVVFSLLTGKVIFLPENNIRFAIFLYRERNPFAFFGLNLMHGLLGAALLYRSLLFIQTNRDFLEESERFDRKIVGLEKEDERVDYLRVFTVLLSTVFIFGFHYYVFFIL